MALSHIDLFDQISWSHSELTLDAQDYLARSLTLARELGDKQNIAFALSNLGILEYYAENCHRSITYLEESLALDRLRGEQHDIAVALHNLAEVVAATGDYARASTLHQEAFSLFQTVESKYGCAFSLQAQGEVACAQDDLSRARMLLEEGMSLFQGLGHVHGIGLCLSGLAALVLKQEWPEQAARLLGAVQKLIEEDLVVLRPPDRRRYQQTMVRVQAQLDEATFKVTWMEGRALSVEQAIVCAAL